MSRFSLLLLVLFFFSQSGLAQGGDESNHSLNCPKNASDTFVAESLYHTGMIGSVAVALLSGNAKSAIDQLGE